MNSPLLSDREETLLDSAFHVHQAGRKVEQAYVLPTLLALILAIIVCFHTALPTGVGTRRWVSARATAACPTKPIWRKRSTSRAIL
jgi:hypothetical protein